MNGNGDSVRSSYLLSRHDANDLRQAMAASHADPATQRGSVRPQLTGKRHIDHHDLGATDAIRESKRRPVVADANRQKI